jgi:hypothetical protein
MSEVEAQEIKEIPSEVIFRYLATTDKSAVFELIDAIELDVAELIKLSSDMSIDKIFNLGFYVGAIAHDFYMLRLLRYVAEIMGDNHLDELKSKIASAIAKYAEIYFAIRDKKAYLAIYDMLATLTRDLDLTIDNFVEEITKKINEQKC